MNRCTSRLTTYWLLAVLCAGIAHAATAAEQCRMVKIAEIPLDMRNGTIEATIDGHATHMLVDTGGFNSLIWRPAAKAFGLDVVAGRQKVYGVGGSDYEGLVTVKDFGLAGFVVHNLTLSAAGHNVGSAEFAGVLGQDFLKHWDLEFDPGAKVLRLMTPEHCKDDQVVYWASSYAVVDISWDWGHHLGTDIKLNGHDARAWFDTGSWSTVVDAELIKRPGYHPTSEGAVEGVTRGVGAAPVDVHSAVFASIAIGQEVIQNPQIRVAELFAKDKEVHLGSHIATLSGDTPRSELPEILIGRDFFRAHRVYVANSQGKVYFTYLGGPIFEIKPLAQTAPQPAATPAVPPAPPASEPAK